MFRILSCYTDATIECTAVNVTMPKMQRFKSQKSAQRFLSTYGPIYNLFNLHRHLISRRSLRTFRNQAMAEWQTVTAVV